MPDAGRAGRSRARTGGTRSGRLRRALAARALGRPAAARRGGARARRRARRDPARRAVRRAGRDHPGRLAGDLPAASRRELRFTALLVTHDLHEAMHLADRIAVMRQGRIEQIGTPAELRDAPATDVRAAHAPAARAGDGVTAAALAALRSRWPSPCSRAALARRRSQDAGAARGRRLQAVRRVVSAGRDVRAAARGARAPGRSPARARRHRDRLRRASRRARSTSIPSTPAPGCSRSCTSRRCPIRGRSTLGSSREFRDRFGVRWLPPLGFENTYAIAVRRETADAARARAH